MALWPRQAGMRKRVKGPPAGIRNDTRRDPEAVSSSNSAVPRLGGLLAGSLHNGSTAALRRQPRGVTASAARSRTLKKVTAQWGRSLRSTGSVLSPGARRFRVRACANFVIKRKRRRPKPTPPASPGRIVCAAVLPQATPTSSSRLAHGATRLTASNLPESRLVRATSIP
jgi:hypothetical protein